MKNPRSFGKDQSELNKSKGKDKTMSGKALNWTEVLLGKFSAILGEGGDQSDEAQARPCWTH